MIFSTKNIAKLHTCETILERIDEQSLFAKYTPGMKLNRVMMSPLREDKHPSFCIYTKKNGSIAYKDYATGDRGNVFKYLGKLWNMTYPETLRRIGTELDKYDVISQEKNLITTPTPTGIDIGIVRQDFTIQDLEYWGQYSITTDLLDQYEVTSCKHYLINGRCYGTYALNDPMYAYRVFDKFKIYRPYSLKSKWRGNLTSYDIQGYKQLKGNSSDVLIITKSLKDVMVLKLLGYDAIAPPSESSHIPEEIIQAIRLRYSKVIVLYDRDKAGMLNARKLYHKYGLPFVFINKLYHVKDISDFIKKYGIELTREFLAKILRPYS
jgi:5S rRNA maturation endonuclease (ribonuclease M5)